MVQLDRRRHVPARGSLACRASVTVVLLLAAIVLAASTPSAAAATALASSSQPSAGTDSLASDLQAYIPDQLESFGVPGLTVALIRDGEIAWEAGFGEANTITGDSVTTDSVFEVASLSKPIAAYAALKLVSAGVLELDKPIHVYFNKPWLSPSEWSEEITLRHLLSHTSGLSKRLHPLDKSIAFPPGERFAYSNVGYQYLQAAVERVSGSSLESVARDSVFKPLAMNSSTYADRPDVASRAVNGHITYGADLAPLLAVLAGCFVVFFLLGIAVQRLWKGRIAITWRLLAVFYAIAAVVSLGIVTWLNGGFNKWSVFFVLMIVVLSVWLAVWFIGGALLVRRLPEKWQSKRRRVATRGGLFLCCILVFVLLANVLSGPVPKGPASTPGAAYSLKSTAGDLARFMIEVANPQHLDPDTAAQMVTPQVRTSDSNSWGLGIAIYRGPDGDWLWHSGDDLDFHALMVVHPETGDGVVVLTNGQAGQMVNYEVAKRAMDVDFTWSTR